MAEAFLWRGTFEDLQDRCANQAFQNNSHLLSSAHEKISITLLYRFEVDGLKHRIDPNIILLYTLCAHPTQSNTLESAAAGGMTEASVIADEPFNPPILMMETTPSIPANDHLAYMRYALTRAEKSPPKPTNYRVGAILVNASTNTILTTGYTLECEGNTHAEQSCFIKLSQRYNIPEDQLSSTLPENTILYTTVEPCFKRLSGNLPCVQRILALRKAGKGITTVYVGVKEPEKFVGENTGRKQLEDAGINVILVDGLEDEILEVATAGHAPS